MIQSKKTVMLIGALPPPYAGPEINTLELLKSDILKDDYNIILLNYQKNNTNLTKGSLNFRSICFTIKFIIQFLFKAVIYSPKIIFLPLNQNKSGFIRDSIFIILASILNKKVVCRFEGGDFKLFYESTNYIFKKIILFCLNKIDILIILGNIIKKQFINLIQEKKIKILYNAIDLNKIYLIPKSNSAINVLFLSKLSLAKGCVDAFKAVPIVIKQKSDICFTFAGEIVQKNNNITALYHTDEHDIQKEVVDLSKISNVFFVGLVEGAKKQLTFSNADIFIFPSYSEGHPIVVLEAMAYGLPIICTRVGALPEILTEYENCLFIDKGNPQQLAEKIIELANNKELRLALSKNNINLIKTKFQLHHNHKQLSSIFKNLLTGKS